VSDPQPGLGLVTGKILDAARENGCRPYPSGAAAPYRSITFVTFEFNYSMVERDGRYVLEAEYQRGGRPEVRFHEEVDTLHAAQAILLSLVEERWHSH
jgi:hypothetical protein